MVTLHAYILRELLKSFGLALVALTVLFTMGGGLYNVVRYEGVSAGDVFTVIPLLVPMAITVTMPIAAVFAAAISYGRLAADNELLACRAAGINVHRTLLAALLLSTFVALFTFMSANFVIPGLAQEIENFVRRNLRDLVAQQLEGRGFVHKGKGDDDRQTLTAERVQSVSEQALQEKGFEVADDLHYLLITNPTYLHVDRNGDLIRFAVANYGLFIFDTRDDPIELTLLVRDARDFEVGKRAVFIGQQQIGPAPVPPLPTTSRLSITDLRNLLRWCGAPWEVPDLAAQLRILRADLMRHRFYQYCTTHLQGDGTLELTGDFGRAFRVQCDAARVDGGEVKLDGVRVRATDPQRPEPVVYAARRAAIRAAPVPGGGAVVELELIRTDDQPVLEYRDADEQTRPRRKATLSLDGAQVPAEIQAELAPYSAARIIDPKTEFSLPQYLSDRRIGLQKSAAYWQRKVVATINFRLAFILSVLVTVPMSAALGIIFRGARALAAVALSLIPFFSVGILMMLGSNLTKEAATFQIGPLVTWGGLVLVLIADLLILRLGVRR